MLVVASVAYFISLPDVGKLKSENPTTSSFMERYKVRHPDKKIKYTWVDYKRISPYLKEAVIHAEDGTFFEHKGVDTYELKKAIKTNIKRKKIVRGASTITQQLAKNLYLSSSKNPLRKIKELLITLLLEYHLDKQRILELYLNVAQWGPGIFGIEEAAKYYYGKHASALTPEESYTLSRVLPSPERRARKIKGALRTSAPHK